ncbi:MAG: extracellular solute-binding protein [Clostridia bacterium]|nr:extracellular solute-binding protein [Clostridia bacterium]
MKNFKRVIALMLCVLFVFPLLVGCNIVNKNNKEGGGQLTESDTIVPEDLKFPGETFTILCREDNAFGEWLHEIAADEDATELVNEMVYKRNLEVEERFELEELKAFAIPGQWDVKDDFTNTFKNSILANSGAYDLIMSHQAYMSFDPSLNDLYTNLYDIPYVKDNLDAKYYYPDVIDELTVNGKLYFLLGDYSLTYWEHAYVLYFNKTLAENNNLPDLYELVRNGEWTVDKMIELSKGKWVDLNGDNWPGEEDSFGYISETNNTPDAYEAHFNVPMTSRNENDEVIFDVDQGKMVSVLEKMVEFKNTDDVYFQYFSDIAEDSNPIDKIFREGRSLFYHAQLNRAQKFRSMETDFGIVPYPKWNENQAGYYTHAQDGYSVGVIPVDATNLEMCGAVVDVLSALSSELVIPAYYDMALRDKYARDDESGEMLDIIREGFTVNFGYFYGQSLNGCSMVFRNMMNQDNTNFVSFYSVNQKGYERKLKELLKSYEDGE